MVTLRGTVTLFIALGADKDSVTKERVANWVLTVSGEAAKVRPLLFTNAFVLPLRLDNRELEVVDGV